MENLFFFILLGLKCKETTAQSKSKIQRELPNQEICLIIEKCTTTLLTYWDWDIETRLKSISKTKKHPK